MYKLNGVMYSAEEIKAKVKELAKQIEKDYAGEELLVVGILKGASVFCADLIREIDLDVDIENKNVLIVEDIIDSGLTLSSLVAALETRKPKSLKLCTLLDKPERRTADIKVDYVGYVIEDKFIVGYGIDFAEKYRNLPYIGIVEDI